MPFFHDTIIADFLGRLAIPNLTILTSKQIDLDDFKAAAPKICRGLILKSYINRAAKNAKENPDRFEIALLYETTDMSNPIAFLVVEKGECIKLPDAWSINLICALETSPNGLRGSGQFLNGLYLYTIATNPEVSDKHGVLELANGYINAAGLASYSKLGFIVNETLYGENCFADYNNLPMITQEILPEKIIDILKGSVAAAYEKPVLCNLRGPIQLYLGICLNLLAFIKNTPRKEWDEFVIDAYEMNDKRIVNYKYLFDLVKDDVAAFENMILSIQTKELTNYSKCPGFNELETILITTKKRGTISATPVIVDVLRPRRANPLAGKTRTSKRGGVRKTHKKRRVKY